MALPDLPLLILRDPKFSGACLYTVRTRSHTEDPPPKSEAGLRVQESEGHGRLCDFLLLFPPSRPEIVRWYRIRSEIPSNIFSQVRYGPCLPK